MQRRDFYFDLPDELIATHPPAERSNSRLLVLDGASGALDDRLFPELEVLLQPGDHLVLNDTRVIPARVLARKDTGGQVELLVERILDTVSALAHVRSNRRPRPGAELSAEGGARLRIAGEADGLMRVVWVTGGPVLEYLEGHGHIPLPPYIRRADEPEDRERYQTVYARKPGAVAAPTAGLHFDQAIFPRLAAAGVSVDQITLHVGAGTFQPVRAAAIDHHTMHSEWMHVSAEVCERLQATRARGGRIVAVGTTVVRALESAAASGGLAPFEGETAIFIRPGYRFRAVDALLTNFHLPESTLLMLVSAFAGRERVLAAYRHAVDQRYRFFSYGDAMLLSCPQPEARA